MRPCAQGPDISLFAVGPLVCGQVSNHSEQFRAGPGWTGEHRRFFKSLLYSRNRDLSGNTFSVCRFKSILIGCKTHKTPL